MQPSTNLRLIFTDATGVSYNMAITSVQSRPQEEEGNYQATLVVSDGLEFIQVAIKIPFRTINQLMMAAQDAEKIFTLDLTEGIVYTGTGEAWKINIAGDAVQGFESYKGKVTAFYSGRAAEHGHGDGRICNIDGYFGNYYRLNENSLGYKVLGPEVR